MGGKVVTGKLPKWIQNWPKWIHPGANRTVPMNKLANHQERWSGLVDKVEHCFCYQYIRKWGYLEKPKHQKSKSYWIWILNSKKRAQCIVSTSSPSSSSLIRPRCSSICSFINRWRWPWCCFRHCSLKRLTSHFQFHMYLLYVFDYYCNKRVVM